MKRSLHAVREVWSEAGGWELVSNLNGATVLSVEELEELENTCAVRDINLHRPAEHVAIKSDAFARDMRRKFDLTPC